MSTMFTSSVSLIFLFLSIVVLLQAAVGSRNSRPPVRPSVVRPSRSGAIFRIISEIVAVAYAKIDLQYYRSPTALPDIFRTRTAAKSFSFVERVLGVYPSSKDEPGLEEAPLRRSLALHNSR